VLKSLAYDPVNRLDLTPLPRTTGAATEAFAATKPITSEAPWILQSFVRGREYCTHSTVRDGEIVAHVCCESSAFQLNYAAVDKPGIEAWVRTFVAATRITGQVSFDFIEDHDGTALAIECNPRTHSAITTFHDQPDLAAAYLGDLPAEAAPVRPRPGSRPTYWIYQESWRLLTRPRSARERLRIVRGGKDAIFDWTDPLPFLLVHHLQIPSLLLRNLMLGKEWTRIDVNIGKLVDRAAIERAARAASGRVGQQRLLRRPLAAVCARLPGRHGGSRTLRPAHRVRVAGRLLAIPGRPRCSCAGPRHADAVGSRRRTHRGACARRRRAADVLPARHDHVPGTARADRRAARRQPRRRDGHRRRQVPDPRDRGCRGGAGACR
jgi:hypothetical protein